MRSPRRNNTAAFKAEGAIAAALWHKVLSGSYSTAALFALVR